MRHRIFIAINLPEEIKTTLSNYQIKWPDLPCRWVKKENLHITLAFLGYLTDEELVRVINLTKKTVLNFYPFTVLLNKICYAPPNKIPPKMVWALGEKSAQLLKLQKELVKEIQGSIKMLKNEDRDFTPHVTLGRIKAWQFRQIEPEERPQVEEDINLQFRVGSIEVMESYLKRGGAEYEILETCKFSK